MAGGFPLTGIDPADPIPGITREILFAQGASSSVGTARDILLFGNKTSGGTETVETINEPISGLDDAVLRFGARSELVGMYRKSVAVNPNATYYAVAIAENGSGTAASCTLTFVNAATDASTLKITVHGETVEVGVESGDAIGTIATNVATKINAQPYWQCTASAALGVVTITASQVGPRGGQALTALRASFTKAVTTTVTKSAVTAGTGADDNTNALAAAANGTYYYHVGPYDLTGTSFSATDNGMGEHITQITTHALPAYGKEQYLICSTTTLTHAQQDTAGAAYNKVRLGWFPCYLNDWTAAMIAAHVAGVISSKTAAHPGANLTDYGKGANDVFSVPVPYTKANIPSQTQIRAHLNNGVSVISWTTTGTPYIVRQINNYCKNGSDYDYRAREGHIVSVADYFWQWVRTRYASQKQPFVAADPAEGETPRQGITYPSAITSLVRKTMDDAADFVGGPLLDTGRLDEMKASVVTKLLTDGGTSCRAQIVAVLHNNKGQFKVEEISDQQ